MVASPWCRSYTIVVKSTARSGSIARTALHFILHFGITPPADTDPGASTVSLCLSATKPRYRPSIRYSFHCAIG